MTFNSKYTSFVNSKHTNFWEATEDPRYVASDRMDRAFTSEGAKEILNVLQLEGGMTRNEALDYMGGVIWGIVNEPINKPDILRGRLPAAMDDTAKNKVVDKLTVLTAMRPSVGEINNLCEKGSLYGHYDQHFNEQVRMTTPNAIQPTPPRTVMGPRGMIIRR